MRAQGAKSHDHGRGRDMEWRLLRTLGMPPAFRAFASLLVLAAVAVPSAACTAPAVATADEDVSIDDDALFGGAVCRVARSATAVGIRVTVRSGAVTAGCVAVAWTAAGVGEVGCLAPAAGTALSAIGTALAAGTAWLTCGDEVLAVVAATQAAGATDEGTRGATGTSACETQPLDGCSVDECLRRYALQKDLCREGGSCPGPHVSNPSEEVCASVDRRMRTSRNCINARRDVQGCFARPDFDGHQTQINQQCTVFRNCQRLADVCEARGLINPPPLLPAPCAF